MIDLVYFLRAKWVGPWLHRAFPEGAARTVSGRVRRYGPRWQMDAPDFVSPPDDIPAIQPVWPLVKGLGPKTAAKILASIEFMRAAPGPGVITQLRVFGGAMARVEC